MISDKLDNVFWDIRGELYYRALEKEKAGKKVLKLNTGNPATFGFEMPVSIKEKIKESIDSALGYCDLKGMPDARQSICSYHKSLGVMGICPDDIYITNGVSEAAYMAVSALCSDADEFLVPSPCYSLWVNMIRLAGGKAVFYNCDEKNAWMPDLKSIESQISNKTKAILIINPNNPTGAVYDKGIIEGIYAIAKKHSLVIFSDEIYDRLVFGDVVHTPTASLGDDVTILTFNGLSKSHCICGFRGGWRVVSGKNDDKRRIKQALTTIASIRLCSNALMQLVIPEALNDSAYTKEMISQNGRIYRQNKLAASLLHQIDGLDTVENNAAFYLYPRLDIKRFGFENDKDFAAKLLDEENILVVAGSGFYSTDSEHFRIVTLPDEATLSESICRIKAFLERR